MFEPAQRFAEGGLKSILQKTAQSAAPNRIINSAIEVRSLH